MGYYIGINTGDLEDTVENYVIKNNLQGIPNSVTSKKPIQTWGHQTS